MSQGLHFYSAYGLVISSEIRFPELVETDENRQADVVIRFGAVPEALENPAGKGVLFQADENCFLLRLDQIARYLVQHGNEIVIDPVHDALESDIRVFLLGSCLGALLHQRGVLALHASAINTAAGAVLFTGHSGVGKSTTLSAFLKRGYPMISDDIAGVVLDDSGNPVLMPAFPRTKLWADAAERLGHDVTTLERVRPQQEKYELPARENFCHTPVPLHRIYHLTTSNTDELRLEEIENLQRFNVLLHNTYRVGFLGGLSMRPAHFKLAAAAAKETSVVRVVRPQDPKRFDELIDLIENDFRAEADPQILSFVSPQREETPADSEPHAGVKQETEMGNTETGNIVWLASYPKSGNTWMRILLTNYLRDADEPADINSLEGGPIASARHAFDENVGVEASDLTAEEIERYRPFVYEQISDQSEELQFLKVHDAFTYTAEGVPLMSKRATRGVLYLIRNPLDVAVSYAHHCHCSVEKIVQRMGRETHTMVAKEDRLAHQLAQRLLTWSNHVKSWVDEPNLDVHVVRYEDMKADPGTTFTSVIRFLGLDETPARIHKAIDFSQFDRVKQQEQEHGFGEKSQRATSFFRKGQVGSWREDLAPELVEKLLHDHREVMTRFGYYAETADLPC